MTIFEGLMVALVCFSIVIAALACLFLLIRLFTFILEFFPNKNTAAETVELDKTEADEEEDYSAGTLKLINVDEKTAAMIMAIVSDESGIPLSELCFKSIKLIENKVNE